LANTPLWVAFPTNDPSGLIAAFGMTIWSIDGAPLAASVHASGTFRARIPAQLGVVEAVACGPDQLPFVAAATAPEQEYRFFRFAPLKNRRPMDDAGRLRELPPQKNFR
jgi:hypothetical protein